MTVRKDLNGVYLLDTALDGKIEDPQVSDVIRMEMKALDVSLTYLRPHVSQVFGLRANPTGFSSFGSYDLTKLQTLIFGNTTEIGYIL